MHMLSKKDLGSDQLDTLRRCRNPTTVVTATGIVQTNEDAQVFVHDLDLFVTVQLLEETPAVLSLGKLCSGHACSHEWKNGETPRLTKHGKTITCIMDNVVFLVEPGLSSSSSSSSASTSRPKDQSKSSSETEALSDPVTTRSDKHACGKPMQTNPDMKASGSRGLAHTQKTKWTKRLQRKAFPICYSPSQKISWTWRRMCSHIPLKEKSQIRKVTLQKWRHKNGSTVFILNSLKTEIATYA